MNEAEKSHLAGLLKRRLEIISDHTWRDREPSAHLEALKQISLEITDWADRHQAGLDARLRHYLGNASFAKALVHLQETSAAG